MQLYYKKETLAQVFFCEFCETSNNTFSTEHVWATASGGCLLIPLEKNKEIILIGREQIFRQVNNNLVN